MIYSPLVIYTQSVNRTKKSPPTQLRQRAGGGESGLSQFWLLRCFFIRLVFVAVVRNVTGVAVLHQFASDGAYSFAAADAGRLPVRTIRSAGLIWGAHDFSSSGGTQPGRGVSSQGLGWSGKIAKCASGAMDSLKP